MGNGSDTIWDRANFAADRAWSEMREFLKEIRPAKTKEERDSLKARFLEIRAMRKSARDRCSMRRAWLSFPAPDVERMRLPAEP